MKIAVMLLGMGLVVSASYAQEVSEKNLADLEQTVLQDALGRRLSIGALLEVEARAGRESGENASDLALATFELGLEAQIHTWVAGRALLLWEEDSGEKVELDEGVITLGGTDDIRWSLDIGKMYLPFGVFNSHFVSDPLVLELAETRQSALMLGYAADNVTLQAAAFNGSVHDDTDDNFNEIVLAIGLTPVERISAGAYWISNIAESDGLSETISAAIAGSDEVSGLPYKRVGGIGGYLHVALGKILFDAEYVSAAEDFDAGFLGESTLQPQAWNLELAYSVSDAVTVAAKYEGTKDWPDAPETQFGVAAAYSLAENIGLGIEYLRGTFDGPTGDRDMLTLQLAVEF
jgi:hypothetical protein